MSTTEFTYDNRTGRGPGRVIRTLGVALPGVRRVWSQVEPYADAWRAHNLRVLDQEGPRWIVLGDSMSQGIGASAYDEGWVGQLADQMPVRDLRVVNLSATGARIRDLIDQQLPAYDALGPRPSDLVTVLIGSNDLFAGRSLREALPDAFGELLERLPVGAVVATLPQPRAAASGANAHIERAVARDHVRVVDLRSSGPTSWRGKLAEDFFHPNDAGYAAIAGAFAPVVVTM